MKETINSWMKSQSVLSNRISCHSVSKKLKNSCTLLVMQILRNSMALTQHPVTADHRNAWMCCALRGPDNLSASKQSSVYQNEYLHFLQHKPMGNTQDIIFKTAHKSSLFMPFAIFTVLLLSRYMGLPSG